MNIWKKHNINEQKEKRQLIEDKEELKNCLNTNDIPANHKSFENFYIRSLRSAPNEPTRAKNRYYNL